ncbi:hypothetical protein SDC9_81289 [bioreactor metagenome]|uniref:CHAT domain-containing protein n=1 Tax=bioreactor metagenome TaxID=1076179 RepID=A0A644Z1V0_9ZZZZ
MDTRIRTLSDKSWELLHSGQYEDAYRNIIEACNLAEQLYGKEHPYYAAVLGNLGFFLYQTNQKEALNYCEQAEEIFEKTDSTFSMDYLLFRNNLAIIYASLGLNDMALAIYKSLLPLAKKGGGLEYATLLTNIGSQYECQQQYAKALEYLESAENIYSERGGVQNPEYYGILNHIGLCYIGLKKYKIAIGYFIKVRDFLQENGKGNGPIYLATLNNLALAYQHSGQSETAIEIYSHILDVMRSTLGRDHPDIVNVLDNLSEIYIQRNDFMKAVELIVDASHINEQLLNRFAGFVPATEIDSFVNKFRYHIDILFSLFHHWGEPSQHYIDIAFDFVFRRKALIFDLELYKQNLLRSGIDEQVKGDFEQLKAIKSEIIRIKYVPPEQIQSKTEYSNTLQQLERECNRLERKISYNLSNSNTYNSEVVDGSVSVREQLPIDTVLIEFVRYTHYDLKLNSKHPPRYAVFFAEYGEDIQLFDLGSAQDIDDMIQDSINRIEQKPEQIYENFEEQNKTLNELSQRLEVLSQKLLLNILPKIGSKRHLIIIPDGLLYLLPFSILKNKDRDLIEQYTITYSTSSRDLFDQTAIEPQNQTLPVIIADPDYDLSESNGSDHSNSLIQNSRNFCEDLVPFLRLEGTRAEGRAIHKIIGGELWLGQDALKARFMELISPKILHIATHGFFQPSCQTATKKWDSDFRSGLVLAGVNSYILGQSLPAEVGNGIITAYEISGLNLYSTDLVVLSACETGIGDIIFCEGVYGFRRAFAIAGARALALSLWSIPDEETKDLMVIFYSFLKSGKGKSEAMREAQLALKRKYPHPYFWGAFILQGDASPIRW